MFNLQCIVLSILYRIGTKSCDVWLNKHIVQSNELCWYFLSMFNINKNKNAIQISTKEAIQSKFSNLWIWSKRFTPNSDDIFRILELRVFLLINFDLAREMSKFVKKMKSRICPWDALTNFVTLTYYKLARKSRNGSDPKQIVICHVDNSSEFQSKNFI